MVEDFNHAPDNQDPATKSFESVRDASNQFADQTRTALDRTADTTAQMGDAAKATASDTQKTISDVCGRSLQEWQGLSQRALGLRSPQDFAAWQMDLIQHFQNNAKAAFTIYQVALTSAMQNVLPAAKQAAAL